ncbi:MAG: copper amine oxidase N-terminal domain-containing protein [Lachnospirales bacterium]
MKKTKKMVALFLALGVATANVYANDYEFTNSEKGIQISNNKGSIVEKSIRWGDIDQSFMKVEADGNITTLEVINENIFVQKYDKDGNYISTSQLPLELPIFGGAYFDGDYTYIAYGQENYNEHDDREVVRVVKYDKNWKPSGTASLYGEDIANPFRSSNSDFVKMGNELVIRSAHHLYKLEGETGNHQGNMTVNIDTNTMEVTGTRSGVGYPSINDGSVSHSFNQYLATSGDEIFAVDLGDAFPRAVAFYRGTNLTGRGNDKFIAHEIKGPRGDNDTGVNLGGLEYTSVSVTTAPAVRVDARNGEITSSSAIIAGRIADDYNDSAQTRNIFVSTIDLYDDDTMESSGIEYITNYAQEDGIKTTTPKLVKVNDSKLYILWQEYTGSINDAKETKYLQLDHKGKAVGEVYTASAALTDVQPYVNENSVHWYATTGGVPTFYTLDSNTNEVTSIEAKGKTNEYEKIVVEYEEEKPPTTDGGDGTTDGGDGGSGSGNAGSGHGASGGSSSGSDFASNSKKNDTTNTKNDKKSNKRLNSDTASADIKFENVAMNENLEKSLVDFSEKNKDLIFKTSMKVDFGSSSNNSMNDVNLSFNLWDVTLTNDEASELIAIRIDEEGNVTYLGGRYNELINQFDFASKDINGNYAVIIGDASNYDQVELKIGSTNVMKNSGSSELDVAPAIVGNTTFVPVRFVTESLGANVSFDNAARTAIIELDGTTHEFVIGEKDGNSPFIENERMLIPVRFVSESFGANVIWYGVDKTIQITK